MQKVYLGLGGNIGNKANNFRDVYKLISTEIGKIIDSSSVYETPPWGFVSKNVFWNQVILVESSLKPLEILIKIKKIENNFGRTFNKQGYSSRPMDVDILYYDDLCINSEELIIPHQHLHQRRFVLVPLAEINPDFVHPVYGLSNSKLLDNCKDKPDIKKLNLKI